MKIIVPMAGMGKRMRPHTLTIPKPLLPVAGKPIVQRLVEDIAATCDEKIEEIAFIIGDFGDAVKEKLNSIAANLGAKASIYVQDEALGTAHAILCAKESLSGKVIVAFADTLFKADFKLTDDVEGTIWVNKIDDPSAFGVVKLDSTGTITDFIEKPETYVSDLAIIGIYYFKDGEYLKNELQYLIDNDIRDKGEYQLTNALENMKNKGTHFKTGEVIEWLDCGNKDATVYTNQRVLALNADKNWVSPSIKNNNSVIIPPCFIGENVELNHAVVGPYVSIGDNSKIENAVIANTIIQEESVIRGINMSNSMIGNHTRLEKDLRDLSVGDYITMKD
jgi:glucose-1-phosphate thymidylyltransferase